MLQGSYFLSDIKLFTMDNPELYMETLQKDGFLIIGNIFSDTEVDHMLALINLADSSVLLFPKQSELFAIRQFFTKVPGTFDLVFNDKLRKLISALFGDDFFVVKSIYFDKPSKSNWFVSWHQDLTISVDQKEEVTGFDFWTVKQNQFSVQPPVDILEDNFTIRIHLDKTTEDNGALKVIPGSHLKGVLRTDVPGFSKAAGFCCNVERGGIMLMKPLLYHSSGRTTNGLQRRVIHVEFSRSELPQQLKWAERQNRRIVGFSRNSY